MKIIQRWKIPFYTAMIGGFVCMLIFLYCAAALMLRSMSPTARLGFIFLPIQGFVIFVIFGFLFFLIGIIIRGLILKKERSLSFILAIPIALFVWGYIILDVKDIFVTYIKVHQISQMQSTHELENAFENRPHFFLAKYNAFIIASIANNPYADPQLLDKIAHINDSSMLNRLRALIDLTPSNPDGLAAIRLVVLNPNVGVSTLTYLSDSSNYSLLGDIAGDKKTPEFVLRKLFNRSQANSQGYLIEWALASNPHTPPDVLRELSKKLNSSNLNDPIGLGLVRNPNTPPDVLRAIKKDRSNKNSP